jgi:hypothetical protein
MRQIIYTSESTAGQGEAPIAEILEQSRHNNAIDGITGFLWSDGSRFLQVFEGPDTSVALTWARILADPRHRNIDVLHDVEIEQHEFGYWTMAYGEHDEPEEDHIYRMTRLLNKTSPALQKELLALMNLSGSDYA